MSALADETRLWHVAQYGIVDARLTGYGVTQIELLIRVLIRCVRILKVALGAGNVNHERQHQRHQKWGSCRW